jgi:AcrR family transcriptional regulator
MQSDGMAEIAPTKTRVLDSAERLFADRGYSATSVRDITTAASVNLAAVQYHFGSKEALLRAVVIRRSIGINRERIEMLARVERMGQQIDPGAIVEAFIAPIFRITRADDQGGHRFARLLGRLYLEDEPLPTILKSSFAPVCQPFTRALKQALPGCTEHDLAWLIHFALGAFAYTLRSACPVGFHTNDEASAEDWNCTLHRLVAFLSGGFCIRLKKNAAEHEARHRRDAECTGWSEPVTHTAFD